MEEFRYLIGLLLRPLSRSRSRSPATASRNWSMSALTTL
jgi:hypothetical protein